MNKMSILFWVRASASNNSGLAPLKIRITLPNDVSNFSSGKTVDVKLWNSDKKRVTGKSTEAERINAYIVRSEAKLKNIYDELEREDRAISSEIIKNIFLDKVTLRPTLLGAIEEHNKAFKDKIENEEDGGSEDTLKIYENVKAKVEKFLSSKLNRKDIFVSEIDFVFVDKYNTWLLQEGHHREGGLSKDSATGHLKKLKKITTYLFKRGYLKIDPFLDKKLSWEDPTAEGLTEDQLIKFENLELRLRRLEKVLDRFIVGCYSGMAHSDISKVSRDDLSKNFADESLWIKLRRTKTGEYCKVPVLPPVQAIIDKYWADPQCIKDNKLFPTVGLNSCNDYLKEIAVFAGIKGINVTTHTARHTFAQMAMDLGVDIEAVAEILGHADSKTTRSTYARASYKFVSNEIQHLKNAKFPQLKLKVITNKSTG